MQTTTSDIEKQRAVASSLWRSGRSDASEVVYKKLLADSPGDVQTMNDYAAVLMYLWRWQEAESLLDRVIEQRPTDAIALYGLSVVYRFTDRYTESGVALSEARRRLPGCPEFEYDYGLWLLKQGRWLEAWPYHQWRFATGQSSLRRPDPEWSGQDLTGKTLFIWAEGGYGDILQFMRFVPLVKERSGAAEVLLEVDEDMISLLRWQPCIDSLMNRPPSRCTPFEFGAHIGLMSLPFALGVSESDVPNQPYIAADPEAAETWRRSLKDGFRVGLCESSNHVSHHNDRARSLPDGLMRSITDGAPDGTVFVNLKQGADYEFDDWQDTAGLVANLDLVITVDTSIAHLAGAMGVPVWMLNSLSGDARWGLGDTTPWYPSMRIFRQTKYMQWNDVVAKVRHELALRTAA